MEAQGGRAGGNDDVVDVVVVVAVVVAVVDDDVAWEKSRKKRKRAGSNSNWPFFCHRYGTWEQFRNEGRNPVQGASRVDGSPAVG